MEYMVNNGDNPDQHDVAHRGKFDPQFALDAKNRTASEMNTKRKSIFGVEPAPHLFWVFFLYIEVEEFI
jgi:hypothetical protein